MKNIIINKLQKDSLGLVLTKHTPKGFKSIKPKDDRYATLSWGMFDEIHEPKLIERYNNTLFNTKTGKITKFVVSDTLYNKYQMDAAVFAWQVDPLAAKYPNMSPYVAFADNPIYFVDADGREIVINYGTGLTYNVGSKLPVPDDPFVQQTINALRAICMNSQSKNEIMKMVNDKEYTLNVWQSYTDTDFSVRGTGNIMDISFNYYFGIKEKNGNKKLPPFIAFYHEFGHAKDYMITKLLGGEKAALDYRDDSQTKKDPIWKNKQEKCAIKNYEIPLSNFFGGLERESYQKNYATTTSFNSSTDLGEGYDAINISRLESKTIKEIPLTNQIKETIK